MIFLLPAGHLLVGRRRSGGTLSAAVRRTSGTVVIVVAVVVPIAVLSFAAPFAKVRFAS